MDAPDSLTPQSLCMIRAAELFPKPQMEKQESQLTVPFKELDGESVKYLGRTDDGILALSNYRIFVLKNSCSSETSVPLGLIETAQSRDLFHLFLNCKDASTVKCSFETAEKCSEWLRRIQSCIGIPDTLETLFAFSFCSWTCEARSNASISANSIAATHQLYNGQLQNGGYVSESNNVFNNLTSTASTVVNATATAPMQDTLERLQRAVYSDEEFMHEVERLGFDLNGPWRISNANQNFKLCPSYPRKFLVPSCISDDTLQIVANFRGSRRLPVVVWRHRKSGAVIARCSQPEVGWLGWRSCEDEQLLKAIADACAFDRGEQMRRLVTQMSGVSGNAATSLGPSNAQQNISSGEISPSSPDGSHVEVALDEVRKVLIVDARSYTSAVTNRARGGGCECIDYYPFAEIEFMNLGNIHVIRKSFHALRQLCASPADVQNWLGTLEKTMWLQHLSGLLAASMTVCHAIEKKGRPVLVHCSDGWDRTPQIVATAQLCLDPYYRTVEGFRVLVEREWLSYGHKFADRCGHGPNSDEVNERCPVFLQWLDLVHQLHKQYPCCFEFSMAYLIKLAQHSLSCLFGTFLCNTLKERLQNSVFESTFSVWPFLSGPMYRNPLYIPQRDKILWPAHNVRDLSLWTEVYLGSLGNQNAIDYPTCNVDGTTNSLSTMFKTRSYGDLITSNVLQNGLSRRSSDPNMTVDPMLTTGSTSENDSIADLQSEREDSPDLIANTAYDTSRKLQNLTTELNNHDEDNFKYLEQQILNANRTNDTPLKNDSEQSRLHLRNENVVGDVTLFSSRLEELNYFNKTEEKDNQNDSTGCVLQEPNSSASTNSCSSLTGTANSISSTTSTQLPEHSQPHLSLLDAGAQAESQNGFNSMLNLNNEYLLSAGNSENLTSERKKADVSLELMQSIDLNSHTSNLISAEKWPSNGLNETSNGSLEVESNLWHNSVNTSTDTLVPIESKQPNSPLKEFQYNRPQKVSESADTIDGADSITTNNIVAGVNGTASTNDCSIKSVIGNTDNILPKVHSVRPNNFVTTSSLSSSSSSSLVATSLRENAKLSNITNTFNVDNIMPETTTINAFIRPAPDLPNAFTNSTIVNPMEESITILPVHQKLEISLNGKCETANQYNHLTNCNNMTVNASTPHAPTMQNCNNNTASSMPILNGFTAQRRQRTSSSNSRRGDGAFSQKQTYNSVTSRFSIPGVRSLPLTPPSSAERQQLAISCPDGLAHALSEQNIRLQQIVYEHKLREESLRREIHDMRIALLKKQCPNCNNATVTNDDQCSAMDNIENASICSWEAVDDRSGPSSCTSSSTQPNTTSVLWVPDHAVSRCTSCQTEFWLGRRKHHCRSCGQIFCADCSEFWAPLPLEKLFTPVRLCGPCYHSETTRMQMSQFQNKALLNHLQHQQHHQQQQQQQNVPSSKPNNTANVVVSTAITPAAATQPQSAAATSKA